jgi:hypothetical protein
MEPSMMGSISMAKNMVKANLSGKIPQHIQENSLIIISKDMENIPGQIKESTKELGKIIKCMERENSNGPMARLTEVSIKLFILGRIIC